MADTTKLEIDSKERVALDLTHTIRNDEDVNADRAYWLNLYSQCKKVVLGMDPQKVLES